jgi:HEAT repeat protein
MDIAEASPTLLELAQSANTVPLKIAAIAALGDVGNAQAEDYLRELATHPDPRMRPALDLALRKLNRRLGG